MKLRTLFFLTHGITAVIIAASFLVASQFGSALHFSMAAICSLLTFAAACWLASTKIQAGLSSLESVVADHEANEHKSIPLAEFRQAAERIGKSAAHWEAVSADTRQQAREIQSMMSLLNHRGEIGQPSSDQLRELLAALGDSFHGHLEQMARGTSEIDQYTRSITDGAETQGHAVIKTTAYVEQLSATIDSVSTSAAAAQSAVARTSESTLEALHLVESLKAGMERIRSGSQNCEKKLRGLSDPSQQISAIVGMISDIAARTDLLALNASIESIRAGEHGRGFAIVADEVRKLAEQASDATREITSLIDSMRLVTQESVRVIVQDREQVDSEVDRAAAAERALNQICGFSEIEAKQIELITASSSQQLQLAQDIVLAVEQISQTAKATRGGAESVCWTMKSLSKTAPQLNAAIDGLRSCGTTAIAGADRDEPIAPIAPLAMPVMVPAGTEA